MILADATIWVDYFRGGNPTLQALLKNEQIITHPFIVAELALGSLHDRLKTLGELDRLPRVKVAELQEVRHMIEAQALYSKGIGLTDAHLIASCLLTHGTQLWTRDGALERAARTLGVIVDLP